MNSSPPLLTAMLRSMALRFQKAQADSPLLSAEVLLAHALGVERHELLKRLLLNPGAAASNEHASRAEKFARRRIAGEPVAYITGCKEFYGRDFAVTPAVLVPRPETELLVDMAVAFARGLEPGQRCFADFGTGSGCIAVTLGLELSGWRGIALDSSPAALAVAEQNAQTLRAPNLSFILADFTSPSLPPDSLDLLVSNPPYVSESEYAALSPEVRFEPKSALVPGTPASSTGSDGLEDIRAILGQAHRLLKPGGGLFMEIGSGQGAAVLAAVNGKIWSESLLHKDLAGLNRVLAVKK